MTDVVIYQGDRRYVDDVISDLEKRVDALEGAVTGGGAKGEAMSEEWETAFRQWLNNGLSAGGCNRAMRTAWLAALEWQASQSVGANETTLRVLPSHAIRRHEGVTIFGDPSQVLKVMAAIESAGATGQQFPYQKTFNAIAAATSIQGGHIAVSVEKFIEAFGSAAPIGDNGAKACYQCKGCGDNDAAPGHCVRCNGTGVEPTSQPAESKRAELTDDELGHLRLIVAFCETLRSIERGSYADDALRALRLFLARASAKGE
jgi:hypothetical protein